MRAGSWRGLDGILATLPVGLLLFALSSPSTALAACVTPGCQVWLSSYNGPGSGPDRANSIVTSPDGSRVFVTGRSPGATSNDYATVAYNAATGAQVWLARYDGGGDDAAVGIGVSPDGSRVFVTGTSVGANGDFATVAYAATDGHQLWVARYNGPGNGDDSASGLALSGDGARVYVAGYVTAGSTPIGAPDYDYGTVAYDSSNGTQLWASTYNGPGNFWDTAYAVTAVRVPAPGGPLERVMVTGRSNGVSPNLNGSDNSDADFATVAYDGVTGAQDWVARYDGTGNGRDLAWSIRGTTDGTRVFVTGESTGTLGGEDYATVAYDAFSGGRLWVSRYAVGGQLNIPLSVSVDPLGQRVFITGFSVNPGATTNYDRSMATVGYDATTGSQLWAVRDTSPDGEVGIATAVSPDGKQVYIAGAEGAAEFFVNGGQVGDNVLLALGYDAAAGVQTFRSNYNGQVLNVDGEAAAVSPDGQTVYVAGGGDDVGADYATIAFATGTGAGAVVVPELPVSAASGVLVAAAGVMAAEARRRRRRSRPETSHT